MANEQTKYFWYECKQEGCNEKFVLPVPVEILSNTIVAKKRLIICYNCPKCKHENMIQDADLNNPLNDAEIKTHKILQQHKDKIKFNMFWEDEEPQ